MKTIPLSLCTVLALLPASLTAHGQGTVIFDQQSSTDETPAPVGPSGALMQNLTTPWGQSFTPDLSSLGIIRLNLHDYNGVDGLGVTLSMNLRAGAIDGSILSTAPSVALPNGFTGPVDFLFPTPVSVAPGTTYYFEPVVESGGPWGTPVGDGTYDGGTMFVAGQPVFTSDIWFREGVVVPEPSALWLGLLGAGALIRWRRWRNRRKRAVLATWVAGGC